MVELAVFDIRVLHFKSFENSMPRYGLLDTFYGIVETVVVLRVVFFSVSI